MGQGGAGRKDHRLALLQDVAAQVDDAWKQLEMVHAVRFPPFGGLHVDRTAVPRHAHVSRHRRQDNLVPEPGHRRCHPGSPPPPHPPPPPPPPPRRSPPPPPRTPATTPPPRRRAPRAAGPSGPHTPR